jgi:hypothetical protein
VIIQWHLYHHRQLIVLICIEVHGMYRYHHLHHILHVNRMQQMLTVRGPLADMCVLTFFRKIKLPLRVILVLYILVSVLKENHIS